MENLNISNQQLLERFLTHNMMVLSVPSSGYSEATLSNRVIRPKAPAELRSPLLNN
jgi:hypothetical protein